MRRKTERVVGIGIPDSDIAGWMGVLRECGMSAESIDRMLSRLNKTYREALLNSVPTNPEETVKEVLEEEGVKIEPQDYDQTVDGLVDHLKTTEGNMEQEDLQS